MAVNPLSPGVYIQEKLAQPGPLQGVSTSEGGFVGFSRQGLENTPITAQIFDIGQTIFGGETPKSETPSTVRAFFDEGGQQLTFVRVLPTSAVAADGAILGNGSVSGFSLGPPATGTTIIGTSLVPVPINPGSIIIKVGGVEKGRDDSNGGFFPTGTGTKRVLSGTINYETGAITLTFTDALAAG